MAHLLSKTRFGNYERKILLSLAAAGMPTTPLDVLKCTANERSSYLRAVKKLEVLKLVQRKFKGSRSRVWLTDLGKEVVGIFGNRFKEGKQIRWTRSTVPTSADDSNHIHPAQACK